jgi:hypothetical protein
MDSDRAQPRRILVVANETVVGAVLHDAVRARAGKDGQAEVLVVAPALNSRLRHWISDVDAARRGAEARLQLTIDRLSGVGIEARGLVGDADPLQAIGDALKLFEADEIIVATHPEGRSHWLERDLVGRARARYSQPIRHVVVDLAAGEEYLQEAAF